MVMRATRIDARGKSRDGTAVLAYLMETEIKLTAAPAAAYYLAGEAHVEERATSRWLGKGAELLGLDMAGAVNLEEMGKLAHGFDPRTGAKLVRTAGKEPVWTPKLDKQGQPLLDKHGEPKGTWKGGHRVGFDCTFSPSVKSADLVFAAADPAERIRIMDAHRDAVAQVVDYMQGMLETGRGHGGMEKIGMRGVVASSHFHVGARSLEPKIHEHVLMYACGVGSDGQWGAWEANTLYDHQQTFGALARAAFAKNLEALGYGIEKRVELDDRGEATGEVYYDVAGVSQDACDAFSTRRKQILAHVAEHGGTKQQAALATRKLKEEPPFDELSAMWTKALNQQRADDPTMFRNAEDLKGLPSILVGIDDDALLRQLQKREAVWGKQDLIGQLAREYVGQKSVSEIIVEADAFLVRMAPELVIMKPEHSPEARDRGQTPGRKFTADRYCAKWWVDGTEQALVDSAVRRQNEPAQALAKSTLAKAIDSFQEVRGFAISDQQRAAVAHVTSGTGVSIVTGWAGTGKTTVADIFVRAFRDEGREVIGVALAWDAAKKLQAETGMESFSAAKLLSDLDKGDRTLTSRTVVVLDEAGMADTVTIGRLLAHIDKAGPDVSGPGAKFILQGDAQQLAPVSAGQGFRLLKDAIGDVALTEIRRQRDVEDVRTAELFYTHADKGRKQTPRAEEASLGEQIMARLETRGQVEHTDTREQAIEAIGDDYLASSLPHRQKLVMGGTRSDVRELNLHMRERLKAAGEISTEDHAMPTTKNGRKQEDFLVAVGDRLRFGKRKKDLGVDNGSVGTVEAVKTTAKGSLVLSVRIESDVKGDDGRLVKLDTGVYDHLDYAYARTVHKAQGATVTSAYLLGNVGTTDTHLSLVGATRARDKFKLYATENDLDGMAERFGMERLKMNALEEGRKETVVPIKATVDPVEHAAKVERIHAGVKRQTQGQKRKLRRTLAIGD
jgi:conjugative relaxase-like TrwC/TraI family protein